MPGDKRREQILQTAFDLFSRRGFSGTTTKDIARMSGVSEAMVFKHFSSKDELYGAILEAKKCAEGLHQFPWESNEGLLAAMEAKDAQIEELSEQLGAIEDQIAKGELAAPAPAPKTRGELEEWGDELEKESAKIAQERKRLDEDRRQLREDEEALEKQMRQMEVSMARERAMLARQETELKRLSAEIQHELDILQRGDAGLREQMTKFQRRAQEVMNKPGSGSGPPPRR